MDRNREIPETMKAAALDRFGGPDELTVRTIPVPEIEGNEVLIEIHTAGIGEWDPHELEGNMSGMLSGEPVFPYVPGTDVAGTIVAVGDHVRRWSVGDEVYAFTLSSPKGGGYAEYTAVAEDVLGRVPTGLPLEQAGPMPADAITALHGLTTALDLAEGDDLMIFGASGGVGHMAVQLAKRMGARVLAVASGEDGVALVDDLGADASVEGHTGDVARAARDFAPDGLDAVLALAGGEKLEAALETLRDGGKVAYPNGVAPAPEGPAHAKVESYDGVPTPEAISKLNDLIERGPFTVHVARVFSLDEAREGLAFLDEHYLGKLALRP